MAVNRFGTIAAGSMWRHVKRGSTYTVIGPCMLLEGQIVKDNAEVLVRLHTGFGIVTSLAKLQTDDPMRDAKLGTHFFLYVANDGTSWVRSEQEFNDGRFERCL